MTKITDPEQVRRLLKGCGLSALRLCKDSRIAYAAVHGFLHSGTDARFSTILKLLDAAGFDVTVKRRTNRKG